MLRLIDTSVQASGLYESFRRFHNSIGCCFPQVGVYTILELDRREIGDVEKSVKKTEEAKLVVRKSLMVDLLVIN